MSLGLSLGLSLSLAWPVSGLAQERWFQVEVTVFSNEAPGDRNAEVWSPEDMELAYPPRLRSLGSILELLFIPALLPAPDDEPEPAVTGINAGPGVNAGNADAEPVANEPDLRESRRQRIMATGPFPPDTGDPFQFADVQRSAFLQLPVAASQFQQTNRALERSPDYRVLFHANWRQPVRNQDESQPLYVEGGRRYGEQSELQGSVGIYFNAGRDRVVADADLWLTEFLIEQQAELSAERASLLDETLEEVTSFGAGAGAEPDPAAFPGPVVATEPAQPRWQLPPIPRGMRPPWSGTAGEPEDISYRARRIYRLCEAREMRSTEFHYLDHPALGMVVTVEPYEVPPLPESDEESAPDQAQLQ